ncbi:hypothetical protein Btru_054814 [Bulinus truncatus]|nr:hypothetical protein Btru_054814 [Bulinus truncatus]
MSTVLVLFLLIGLCTMCLGSVCEMTQDVCEFWLEVEHRLTMMDNKMAVYSSGGKLYHYNVTDTATAQPVDSDHVIVADGWEKQRLVITVNNTMPGPSIEVGLTAAMQWSNKENNSMM